MTPAYPNFPLLLVVVISVAIGLAAVFIFRYTSNQKAIHRAKNMIQAHLLALRLFQDQIPVVLRTYGSILLAVGHYLRLALLPLLITAIPLTFLIAQLDRCLGYMPLKTGESFLIKVHVSSPETMNVTTLQLPPGIVANAPAVYISSEDLIVWRAAAESDGIYTTYVRASNQVFAKQVVVASGLARLSPIRLRGRFWERIFVSGEAALPQNSAVQSIEVDYPPRSVAFAGFVWNWIWLAFVLSLLTGFIFKSIFGIEI